DGPERPLDRCAAHRRLRAGAAAVQRAGRALHVGRGAVRRLPDAERGVAARRPPRLRDGRPTAGARARRAGPARHPGAVRLQERQVVGSGRPREVGGGRLLGAARLRPRRVGRPVEWPLMTRYVQRFSRTERTLHWVNAAGFLLLLATGLILYLPSL